MRRLVCPLACLALSACWASHERAAPAVDAAGVDSGARDAGPDRVLDAGPPDAGPPDAGPPPPLREPRWVQIADEGESPPARLNHFAVYDAEADRVLVFGGFDPYADLGRCCITPYLEHRDVWALDRRTGRWAQVGELDRTLLAVMPSEVAVDAARDRLVLIAQTGFDGAPSEVIALDRESFRATVLARGPWPGGAGPLRVAWDRAAGSLIAHDAFYTDVTPGVWRLDLATDRWSTLDTERPPETRFHNPLVAGPRGALFMYAGYAHAGEAEAELWRLDPDAGTWSQLPVRPPQPGRWSFRALFEPVRDRLIVYGGTLRTEPQGTVFVDPRTGEAEPLALDPAPVGRRDFSMVLDSRRREAVVFGGAVGSTRALADTWVLELP